MKRPPVISASGLLAALVVGGWGALYVFLLATDRTFLYLSPRTAWLVPIGAVLLAIALVGRILFVRDAAGLGGKEALGFTLVALPVVIVLALPPASRT